MRGLNIYGRKCCKFRIVKRSNIAISLPDPCHEDWNKMTPVERGRFCNACQKTVIDFTLLNDGQVIDIFKRNTDGQLCGRFVADQLDRELVDTRVKPSIFSLITKRVAAMLLLFQSANTALAQQAKDDSIVIHNSDSSKTNADTIQPVTIVTTNPDIQNQMRLYDETKITYAGAPMSYNVLPVRGWYTIPLTYVIVKKKTNLSISPQPMPAALSSKTILSRLTNYLRGVKGK